MRWNGFRGSLVFAAVAAAGFVPFTAIAAPLLGWHSALAAFAVCAVSGYLAGLAGNLRKGIGAALVAGAIGTGFALVAPSTREALLGAGLALGLCRSGLVYRARFARAVVLETLLLLCGAGLAGHLYTGTLFSAALSVWSFFLVQSAFFLVGGVSPRRQATPGQDPFDAARSRALEILEQAGAKAR